MQKQRVAIGRSLGDLVGADRSTAAAGVFHHDGLAERLGELLGEDAREQGYPNMELFGWNGFFAPAKTPAAVVATIQAAMASAARDPDVKRRLAEVGAEVMGSTQDELGKVLRDQVAVVRPLVEELKLVVQ